jgi:hypothetical protein
MLLNVTEFKYLGKTLMNQDCIREEMKTTLNMGNFCYCSVLYLLFSGLLLKKHDNSKIQKCNFASFFCVGVKHGLLH